MYCSTKNIMWTNKSMWKIMKKNKFIFGPTLPSVIFLLIHKWVILFSWLILVSTHIYSHVSYPCLENMLCPDISFFLSCIMIDLMCLILSSHNRAGPFFPFLVNYFFPYFVDEGLKLHTLHIPFHVQRAHDYFLFVPSLNPILGKIE